MLAIRLLVLGRCWSEILQIPARDFFDEIAPLRQVFPQFVYVLGLGEATTHPYNGNRFVLRSRTWHFGGGKTSLKGRYFPLRGRYVGDPPLACAYDPKGVMGGRGQGFLVFRTAVIGEGNPCPYGFVSYTHDNFANVLPIFQVTIGIFDSLPVKHLTDRGSNDPFLYQMEHFTTILQERYGIFHCQSA